MIVFYVLNRTGFNTILLIVFDATKCIVQINIICSHLRLQYNITCLKYCVVTVQRMLGNALLQTYQ